MVEKSGVERSGVEKSEVEISFNPSKGCAVCGKTFTGKYANERDNHMVEYHQEVQCKVCQQTLPNKREYKEHMYVEHKNQAKICEVKVCQMSVPLDR